MPEKFLHSSESKKVFADGRSQSSNALGYAKIDSFQHSSRQPSGTVSSSLSTSLSLLDRLRSPDRSEAWRVFFDVYHPLIEKYLVIAGVPASDVDDVVQEVLTKVFVAVGQFDHNGRQGAFRKWLRTIVVREALEFLRRSQKHRLLERELRTNTQSDVFQEQWDREHDDYVLQKLLKQIQSSFTHTTWTAFSLQALSGTSPAQVAERLGISVNAALLAKSRVLRRLREMGKGMIEF